MNPEAQPGKIEEIEGDLFDAPDGAALIHACNCQGSWGAGIAKAFKIQYPTAFKIYRSHCSPSKLRNRGPHPLEGSTLIIPPQARDYGRSGRKHWIICLFTSRGFGRNVSSKEVVLKNTELAIDDMKLQLRQMKAEGESPIALWSCRFNSGLFGVDWSLSRKALEEADLDVTVLRPQGE